jgi:hypothetical protein
MAEKRSEERSNFHFFPGHREAFQSNHVSLAKEKFNHGFSLESMLRAERKATVLEMLQHISVKLWNDKFKAKVCY